MRAILIDWLVDVHLKFKVRGRQAEGAWWGVCRLPSLLPADSGSWRSPVPGLTHA